MKNSMIEYINKKGLFKFKREHILMLLGICIILWIGLYRLNEQFAPVILMDEFGYWSIGAFFSGRDWSAISQFSTFYSYGYGLVLGVLMLVFANTAFLYKAAIMLNAVFIALTFILLIRIGGFLFENEKKNWVIFSSFLACLYPSFCANIHVGWCESLLVLTYTLSVFLLTKILMSESYINICLFTVSLVFCYAVHQRALGILFFGILIMVVLFWNKNIAGKKFAAFIVTLFALLIVHKLIKGIVLDGVFSAGTNPQAQINDYGSIVGHVIVWANLLGLGKLAVSAIGKLFYLLVGTTGIFGVACYYMVSSEKEWIKNLRGKQLSLKQLVYLYMLLSMGATILIASVYTLNAERLDVVVYGRYTEWALAPFLLIGLSAITEKRAELIKPVCWLLCVMGLMELFLLYVYSLHPEWTEFFAVCSYVMAFYRAKSEGGGVDFLRWSLVVSCFYMVILILGIRLRKIYHFLGIIILLAYLPASIWCTQRIFGSNYRSDMCRTISTYFEDTTEPVYFIWGDYQSMWYVADIQVLNPNLTIENIEREELAEKQGYVLITTGDECMEYVDADSILVSNSQIALLYVD